MGQTCIVIKLTPQPPHQVTWQIQRSRSPRQQPCVEAVKMIALDFGLHSGSKSHLIVSPPCFKRPVNVRLKIV